MASEYAIKNIDKAKFFIDFFDSVEEEEVFLGRFEIKDDNTKKFLSFLVDYNVKNYFVSSLFFGNDYLFALENDLGYKGVKIIINKNNDSVDAIFKLFFGFGNSSYDRYQRVYFIIDTVFISRDFLIYLLESSKEFYKADSKMMEIVNGIIQFVQNDKHRFFLISYSAKTEYVMKLNLINAYNPSISFMLNLKYVIFSNGSDFPVLLEDSLSMKYLTKYDKETRSLYIENIMNHFGGNVKENTKMLVRGIFSKLLSFYIKELGFPELPNVKVTAPSYKVKASKRYLSENIKHIRKKNRFWALFLETARNKYFPSILRGLANAIVKKFKGKITLIESVLLYDRFKTFKINVYIIINEPSSNSEFYQKFLEIEIREELYTHTGQEEIVIEILFEQKEFNSYFYSKKENLKAFVEDVAEALVKLGIISTTNDLYFLARIEKARQLYK